MTDGDGSLWWCYGEGRLCWRIFCGLNISANRLELNGLLLPATTVPPVADSDFLRPFVSSLWI